MFCRGGAEEEGGKRNEGGGGGGVGRLLVRPAPRGRGVTLGHNIPATVALPVFQNRQPNSPPSEGGPKRPRLPRRHHETGRFERQEKIS